MDQEPGPDDIVIFPDIMKSRIARIMTAAATMSTTGQATVDEWQALRATVFTTSWFNTTIPVESTDA